eukprot:3227775-Rhodomonas_salina.6
MRRKSENMERANVEKLSASAVFSAAQSCNVVSTWTKLQRFVDFPHLSTAHRFLCIAALSRLHASTQYRTQLPARPISVPHKEVSVHPSSGPHIATPQLSTHSRQSHR